MDIIVSQQETETALQAKKVTTQRSFLGMGTSTLKGKLC